MAYQFTQTGAEIQDILDLAQLQIAAPYDSASSYSAGDYCTKDDGFYVCTASTSGTWDGSKWSAVTVGDVLSSLNATLTNMSNAVVNNNEETVSVPSGSGYTLLGQRTLAAGTWLILFGAAWAGDASGYRLVQLTTSSTAPTAIGRANMAIVAPASSTTTTCSQINMYKLASSTTYYLWGRQNSGSALNAYPFINTVRLR